MSAQELSDTFLAQFNHQNPNFSVINFANPDMVGHTGVLKATITGIEMVDTQIGKIITTLKGGIDLIITADHGNAESLKNNETGSIDKEHSTSPVPFIYASNEMLQGIAEYNVAPIDEKIKFAFTKPIGLLADVAPTIIELMNLQKPTEMTGQSEK